MILYIGRMGFLSGIDKRILTRSRIRKGKCNLGVKESRGGAFMAGVLSPQKPMTLPASCGILLAGRVMNG
jgi:hypothetical protein